MRVITFCTFDLFHIGHLRILERAAALGSELVVGVSSDELNFGKKGHYPVYDEDERMAIVSAIRHVSKVFREDSLELTRQYRSEEHTSELQSLMRISYAVFCLKKKNKLQMLANTDTQ